MNRKTTKSPRSNRAQRRLDTVISQVFGIKVSDIHSPSTKRQVADARLTAMYLQKELLKKSYPQIAAYFGKKSHSTCISAHKTITGLLETNTNLRNKIEECKLIYANYTVSRSKQRYNLHFLIGKDGIRVSGPDRTIYVPASQHPTLQGILQQRIIRLVKKHNYSLQLTIE
ncbi:MAG: hypothetical protein IPN08_15930 [Bacteroidales bacterium]|nr:hypothetical protein [Bacteroidales bacterium]MBK9358846.1 hypothetical protein [Bacteroidales bacterium]